MKDTIIDLIGAIVLFAIMFAIICLAPIAFG